MLPGIGYNSTKPKLWVGSSSDMTEKTSKEGGCKAALEKAKSGPRKAGLELELELGTRK